MGRYGETIVGGITEMIISDNLYVCIRIIKNCNTIFQFDDPLLLNVAWIFPIF